MVQNNQIDSKQQSSFVCMQKQVSRPRYLFGVSPAARDRHVVVKVWLINGLTIGIDSDSSLALLLKSDDSCTMLFCSFHQTNFYYYIPKRLLLIYRVRDMRMIMTP